MKVFQGVIPILLLSLVEYSQSEETRCVVPKHYQELGCKPILATGETCASQYNCDHLKEQDKMKCYLNGRVYNSSSELPREHRPHCVQWASCGFGSFHSGHFDCVLPLFTTEDVGKCILYKDHDVCCERKICGKEEIAKYSVCHMEGEKHYSGEVVASKKDTCMECTCDEKFNNATDIYRNPNCRVKDCAIEFWYLNQIRDGCAPMYYGTNKCCPSSTKCPSSDDKILPAEPGHLNNDSALKCKFGKLELRVGERVSHEIEECMECECRTPPMIDCRLNDKCLDELHKN